LIYALIYGGGPQRIGSIVGGGIREGRALTERFISRIPAFKTLKAGVISAVASRGGLYGLDGRPIPIRSQHSALNALLQSCGSILMKRATIIGSIYFKKAELDVHQVAHIHDEIQYDSSPTDAESVGRAAVDAIKDSGTAFELRCPLSGEYKIGETWADTH